ncbi:Uncharacterised protein [uncultured archaeon]|nr:Uncharacterised protein [uncultured archaeon]
MKSSYYKVKSSYRNSTTQEVQGSARIPNPNWTPLSIFDENPTPWKKKTMLTVQEEKNPVNSTESGTERRQNAREFALGAAVELLAGIAGQSGPVDRRAAIELAKKTAGPDLLQDLTYGIIAIANARDGMREKAMEGVAMMQEASLREMVQKAIA